MKFKVRSVEVVNRFYIRFYLDSVPPGRSWTELFNLKDVVTEEGTRVDQRAPVSDAEIRNRLHASILESGKTAPTEIKTVLDGMEYVV